MDDLQELVEVGGVPENGERCAEVTQPLVELADAPPVVLDILNGIFDPVSGLRISGVLTLLRST